jgi:putative ABC transport system permease protein
VLGLAIAWAGVQGVVALRPANIPRVEGLGIELKVVLFTFAVAVGTGLLFGLVPALRASRSNLQDTLREGGRSATADRGGQRLRRGLVVAEMALALTLLTGAGLLIKSFARVSEVDPGFNPDRLLTFNLALPRTKYTNDTTRLAFWNGLMPRIAAVPGVQAVAATSVLPFSGNWSTGGFRVEGYQPAQGQPGPWGDLRVVSAGFHETMGVPLLKGRFFSDRDDARAQPVAIVDDEAVRRFWPDTDPIGKRITFGNPADTTTPVPWITVVGVVGHTKHEALDADNRIQVYFPVGQSIGFGAAVMSFAVRTAGEPRNALAAVTSAIHALDRDVPVANVSTMEQSIGNSLGQRRFAMLLLGLFATLALALASIGMYGVMSYAVTQRSHELGVRMTLGATRRDVLGLVMRNGMVLVGLGALIGIAGAFALRSVIQSQLFGVRAGDPATFALVVVTLVVVAAVAILIPALRATRLDPVVALREE